MDDHESEEHLEKIGKKRRKKEDDHPKHDDECVQENNDIEEEAIANALKEFPLPFPKMIRHGIHGQHCTTTKDSQSHVGNSTKKNISTSSAKNQVIPKILPSKSKVAHHKKQ